VLIIFIHLYKQCSQKQIHNILENSPVTHPQYGLVFLLIKTTQASYGVKNGDYYRYRRYCSRKVLKLRKTINYKYGTKNKHIKKDIASEKGNDKKILQILLFFAEKFWAYGNECKITSTLKKHQNSRARFLAIKKLKRAYQWSVKLY
jgi:signal recognition particle subunit SRP68